MCEEIKEKECKICNVECKSYKSLSLHIIKNHKITIQQYYDKFLKKINEGVCYCNNKTTFQNIRIGYAKFCSMKCLASCSEILEKRSQTYKNKTGWTNPSQNPEIKKKKEETSQNHYGCNNPNQSLEIKRKKEETNLIHRNTKYPQQSLIVQEKTRQTIRKFYNCDNIMQSKKIQNKRLITCRKNLGVDWPIQSKLVQKKYKETSVKNWNFDNPLKSTIVQEKSIQTCLKNYNVLYPMQSEIVQEKSKQTSLEHFGVDNYAKTSEFRLLARENLIQDIKNDLKDGETFSPRTGYFELEVFNELQLYCPYPFLTRKEFICYFPDVYIKELNLIVELYEPWHKHTWSMKRDPIRQKDLEDHLNCKFFIIWLENWKENKEKVIEDFKKVLNEYKTIIS